MARKKNILKNPLFLAVLLVLFCICGIFIYTKLNVVEQKSISEMTGDVCGIKLDIRTLPQDKIDEIINTEDKDAKMQILQDCLTDNQNLIPMSNVSISLSLNDKNKFMGVSGYEPLDIKLPKGNYLMLLSYPNYKILNNKFELVDTMFVSFEDSNKLSDLFIIMVPEKNFSDVRS